MHGTNREGEVGMPGGAAKLLTPTEMIVRIVVITSATEFLITIGLQILPLNGYTLSTSLVDASLLALVSAPALYSWVIKPYVEARDGVLAHIGALAFTDPLTELANRRLIAEHLHKIIAGSLRHRHRSAVLMIDLDGFKSVNDRHGHHTGDAVLLEIANRLKRSVRSEDVVGRLGGDEFVVLLHRLDTGEEATRDAVLRLAQTLIDTINLPIDLNGKDVRVGASIGVRLLGTDDLDPHTAISHADHAMYRAKEVDGCHVAFFDS